ncbi:MULTISPECIES: ABC transporter permease [Brevibacillus]|jgi:putative ABC transport system permease protein|uniref:Multidrug ABC transporter substrate-binding protein n=1 Tax=Brevibacillus parabrevis TaxID=54914 RepID=A0A4Y3PB39_BREPA|nr:MULTISPECIES: ABC transporter permease [Brevibacillus]MBU8712919.1 ABC transporter permease [Brevibacillus parabrevis]MDH6348438.1 putative ABC transport system permease protein [Brevibacillus sp. 1238]MDR5000570.1 ABC transporter permease [Brevibacillus parabrevis]MED2256470.1 ABC transporter permease [Brevibacillus parabrevis]NRQ52947.1 ABC transporter permease [Brevibacillus sp. HD1.4A]
MSLIECVRVSFRSIRANGLRSVLTMLGIIIGVAAVIAMVAIGEGTSSSVASQINGLGSNLLIVSPGQATQGRVSLGAGSLNTLTMADAEAIAENDSVAGVAPSVNGRAQIVWGSNNYSSSLEGTTADFLQVRNAEVAQGRFFSNFEVTRQFNVAVVGTEVVSNLFKNATTNPIGQTVQINRVPFTIIGVLKSQGSSGMTNNDDRILIPITTAMSRLTGGKNVGTIYVSAASSDVMDKAQQDIRQTLRAKHNLRPQKEDDFRITSQSDILSTAQEVSSSMTALLSGIAAISLIVGGIGVMNIMLVSVTERTREIGIRKAIGAKRRDILRQFLIEAVTLSLIGGILGIAFGVGAALLISKLGSLSTSISLTPILYAFLTSSLVGVIFGVYPARKAAQLKPIDALRYE